MPSSVIRPSLTALASPTSIISSSLPVMPLAVAVAMPASAVSSHLPRPAKNATVRQVSPSTALRVSPTANPASRSQHTVAPASRIPVLIKRSQNTVASASSHIPVPTTRSLHTVARVYRPRPRSPTSSESSGSSVDDVASTLSSTSITAKRSLPASISAVTDALITAKIQERRRRVAANISAKPSAAEKRHVAARQSPGK